MEGMTFELDGLEELAESLTKVQRLCPDFALKQLNRAGNQFKKDVITRTAEKTVTRKGNLIGGYKKTIVVTSAFGKSFEAQISGGNRKARHFHLVEHGHEGYLFGNYIGFVEGKHMMKDTIDKWEREYKIIPYAKAAIDEAIKKGFISDD